MHKSTNVEFDSYKIVEENFEKLKCQSDPIWPLHNLQTLPNLITPPPQNSISLPASRPSPSLPFSLSLSNRLLPPGPSAPPRPAHPPSAREKRATTRHSFIGPRALVVSPITQPRDPASMSARAHLLSAAPGAPGGARTHRPPGSCSPGTL